MRRLGARHRWAVLAVSTAAQASTAAYFLGLAAVTPALRTYFGLDLPAVGALVGSTSVGLVATLIAWGAAADRYGERPVMIVGLAAATACLAVAALLRNPLAVGALLVGAGAAGASVNAASGRAVLIWFPADRRGLAMSVRQTAVPLGAAAAAVALPAVAAVVGVPGVFAALASATALAAAAVARWVRDPPGAPAGPRPMGRRGPVRATLTDRRLWRLSGAAGLLVVPQFLGSVFMVELLHTGHGMPVALAGGLFALTQLLGAAGRLGAGAWSDRVGSRLRPLRTTAAVIAGAFALAALANPAPVGVLAVVLVAAAASAISWNGLAFTAAGEMVPRHRVGAALAFENTANYLSAAFAPALGGAVAQLAGWPAMLATGATAAAVSWWLLGGLLRP